MKRERRRARSMALLTLYEVDCVDHSAEEVLARHLENAANLSLGAAEFVRTMVLGTLSKRDVLDELIAVNATEWPIEELAIVDRNILRLALWEMATKDDTPIKVAINEAVELAKRFGSVSAPRFVNGVLGALASQHEEIRWQLNLTDER